MRRLQQECPDFLQQLDEKGLIYQLYFGGEDLSESYIQRSWKTLYKVNDREELEDK